MSTISPVDRLYSELMLTIFAYLSPKELTRCLLVCSVWRNYASTYSLWNRFCQREKLPPLSSENADPKDHYIRYLPQTLKKRKYVRQVQICPRLHSLFESDSLKLSSFQVPPAYSLVWHKNEVAIKSPRGAELWNIVKSEPMATFESEGLKMIDFDDQSVITAQTKGKGIEMSDWPRENWQASTYCFQLPSVQHLVLRSDQLFLANQKKISIVDRRQQCLAFEYQHEESIFHVYPEENLLLSAGERTLYVWDERTEKPANKIGVFWPTSLYRYEEKILSYNNLETHIFDLRNGMCLYKSDHFPSAHFIDLQGHALATLSCLPKKFSLRKSLEEKFSVMDLETLEQKTVFSTSTTKKKYEMLLAIRWIESSLYGITQEGNCVIWSS